MPFAGCDGENTCDRDLAMSSTLRSDGDFAPVKRSSVGFASSCDGLRLSLFSFALFSHTDPPKVLWAYCPAIKVPHIQPKTWSFLRAVVYYSTE